MIMSEQPPIPCPANDVSAYELIRSMSDFSTQHRASKAIPANGMILDNLVHDFYVISAANHV